LTAVRKRRGKAKGAFVTTVDWETLRFRGKSIRSLITTWETTGFVAPSCALLQAVVFLKEGATGRCNLLNKKALESLQGPPNWVQGLDSNQRPSGYEPDELPGCSTLQQRAETCCAPSTLSTPIPYLRRTFISACPASGSSRASVTNVVERFFIRISTSLDRTFTVKTSPSLWSCPSTLS
jgi:hypothetical protein